jgi:hypothetical protein
LATEEFDREAFLEDLAELSARVRRLQLDPNDVFLDYAKSLPPDRKEQAVGAFLRLAKAQGRHAYVAAFVVAHLGSAAQKIDLAKEINRDAAPWEGRCYISEYLLKADTPVAIGPTKDLAKEAIRLHKTSAYQILGGLYEHDRQFFISNSCVLFLRDSIEKRRQFGRSMLLNLGKSDVDCLQQLVRCIGKTSKTIQSEVVRTFLSELERFGSYEPPGSYDKAVEMLQAEL